MSPRKTILAAALLILLVLYIYLFELKEDGERLFPFHVKEVQALALDYQDQKIRMSKGPSGKWVLNENPTVAADEATIKAILSTLSVSQVSRIIEETPNRADLMTFGLDKPLVTVQIGLQSGERLPPILVGEMTPIGYSAYVKRRNESPVLLTDAAVRISLERSPNDFRDKRIFHFDRGKVAKLEIQTKDESLVLVRGQKGRWAMEAPEKGEAKRQVVVEYLTALLDLRAKNFADDKPKNLEKYQLDSPALYISMENSDAENIGILLIGKSGEFFAKRVGSPTVYTIDSISYNQINKTAGDFLDRG
jgi:hypothetical protein